MLGLSRQPIRKNNRILFVKNNHITCISAKFQKDFAAMKRKLFNG